jgi:hypothetical protein
MPFAEIRQKSIPITGKRQKIWFFEKIPASENVFAE